MPWSGERRGGAAARACHTMQVDIMRHLSRGMVVQVEFHQISLTNPDEASRDRAAERPKEILHPVRKLLDHFADLQRNNDLGGVFARDWGRHVRRVSDYRYFFSC